MRFFQRQDALLLAGLTVALVIVFAPPISRLIQYAEEIERDSGLALLPALVVLTGVFVFHLSRKRLEIQARASAAEAAKAEAERRTVSLEQLVAFGHALARSLDHETIRDAIHQHLSRVAETDRTWVLLRQDNKWEALWGDTRAGQQVIAGEGLAERLLSGEQVDTASGRNTGFPLVVGGTAIGVLGVTTPDAVLEPARHRVIEAAAALLAVSVKNAQLFREVRENSMRDPLTGCVMRTHAAEVIDAELRRARRTQMPVSLLMFDLDYFKQINDRYGHLCGDAVLASVGRCMREVLRGSDLKCRYGGEEFLVLLPETPLSGARRVAETLRSQIEQRPVLWAGHTLTCTASFGVTQAVQGEMNIEAMIGRADAAMYRAKKDGRNCVRVHAESFPLVSDQAQSSIAKSAP